MWIDHEKSRKKKVPTFLKKIFIFMLKDCKELVATIDVIRINIQDDIYRVIVRLFVLFHYLFL